MPQYSYTYLASDGKKMSGLTNAKDRSAALVVLRGQGVRVLSIREAKAQASRRFKLPGKKVGIKDLVVFTRELATMIDAGVPLPRSLATLSEQTENKHFKVVIEAACRSPMPWLSTLAPSARCISTWYGLERPEES